MSVFTASVFLTWWGFSDVSGTKVFLCQGAGLLRFCKIWGAEHLWSSILDPCERTMRSYCWLLLWKHTQWVGQQHLPWWPTWAFATMLHRPPASASVAEVELELPLFIPGSKFRESRWSSGLLPWVLTDWEKNFSGSVSRKKKTAWKVQRIFKDVKNLM